MAHLGPVGRWEIYSKLRLIERIGVLADADLRMEIESRLLEHLGIEFKAEEL